MSLTRIFFTVNEAQYKYPIAALLMAQNIQIIGITFIGRVRLQIKTGALKGGWKNENKMGMRDKLCKITLICCLSRLPHINFMLSRGEN